MAKARELNQLRLELKEAFEQFLTLPCYTTSIRLADLAERYWSLFEDALEEQ